MQRRTDVAVSAPSGRPWAPPTESRGAVRGICGTGGAPGNRTPLGWMQATVLPTRAPCESDRRDSNPVRSAGNAVCFRPDTTVASRAPRAGFEPASPAVRDRHPGRLDDRGDGARTEGIEPSPAVLETAWTPCPRPYDRAPRAGFEPRILRFRAEDPAVRRPRNEDFSRSRVALSVPGERIVRRHRPAGRDARGVRPGREAGVRRAWSRQPPGYTSARLALPDWNRRASSLRVASPPAWIRTTTGPGSEPDASAMLGYEGMKSPRSGSNRQPSAYKAAALPS